MTTTPITTGGPVSAVGRVALIGGSERLWTIRRPLEAVGIDVAVNPDHPADADATIVFSPGRTLFEQLVEGVEGPLVYRLSGDYWLALREQRLGRLRGRLADQLFGRVDGALTPDPRLDSTWRERTDVTSTAVVGLPIQADEWPTRTHDDGPLGCLTLGNFDYLAKTDPVIDWLPYVNAALDEHDGRWAIAGDGRHADRLARAAEPYPHIEYVGYVDATTWLARTDVLLHPSEADIAYPNAVLEAMACSVPVVTTPSRPFTVNDHVCTPGAPRAVKTLLGLLAAPDLRAQLGGRGQTYVRSCHAPTVIGRQLSDFLTACVRLHHFG